MADAPKRSRWWLWLLLAASPCFCLCGGSSFLLAQQQSRADALKAKAAPMVAALEAEHARTGTWPQTVPKVEHVNYELLPDGGFLLFFADPPLLLLPSDFYNVYNPTTHEWDHLEDVEVWPSIGR